MKKSLAILLSSYFVLASATISITAYESKISEADNFVMSAANIDKPLEQNNIVQVVEERPAILTASIPADNTKVIQPKTVAANTQPLSRGGTDITKTSETKPAAKSTAAKAPAVSKSSVEVLDWWTQAKNTFKIGTKVVVQDVRTGKTFQIVRTMGSNHADCEAASKADADIIKSIWGGFSWDTRPIIINVAGRRLAASMSSLPHAGVDSAPAFKVVDNRSEGYGRGENLDAIKNNGMDGHFDVHFLNSTRHKDGKVDPRHQASIAIAGKQ